MKKILIIILASMGLLYFNVIFADSYQEGLKLYEQGKYLEAIEKFKISLQDSSADKDKIHLYLGIAYYAAKQDDRSFTELDIAKMSSKKETREAAYSNFAVFSYLKGDFKSAETNCENAIRENPGNPVHYFLLGQICMEKNEIDKAKECFNRSIEVSDKSYLAYFSLGNIYVTEKDYKKAYEYFKKTIEIREDYISAYKNIIALIPEEIIPVEEYKKILTKYLALNPSDTQAKQKLEKLEKGIQKTNQAKGSVN